MPKGRKRVRGVPELHDELKKQVNVVLTPTGIEGLDAIAAQLNLSRSELIEQIGRNLIPLIPQKPVLFRERHKLHKHTAVCLVRKGEQVLYVCLSSELIHLHPSNQGINLEDDAVHVDWLECNNCELLPDIKEALIKKFNPILQEKVQVLETPSTIKGQATGWMYEQIGNLAQLLAPNGRMMVELPIGATLSNNERTNSLLISMTEQGPQVWIQSDKEDEITSIEGFSEEFKQTVQSLIAQLSEHIVPLINSDRSDNVLEKAKEGNENFH